MPACWEQGIGDVLFVNNCEKERKMTPSLGVRGRSGRTDKYPGGSVAGNSDATPELK